MKKIITLVFLLLITVPVFAKHYDFRRVNWGMSKAAVMKSEQLLMGEEKDNEVTYSTSIANKSCNLIYDFYNNKLNSATYYFAEDLDKNECFNDFKQLKSALLDKYGHPIKDDITWKNDQYKNDENNWGLAVSLGQLRYETQWQNNRTEIQIVLVGGSSQMIIRIRYLDKHFSAEKENKKQMKEDL